MAVPGIAFVRELDGIAEYQLKSNGLQILLAPDSTMPVAGVMVTYNVGSRNEAVGHTGATHLLEHLMFKGSKKFNKKKGGDIMNFLQDKGARVNASTWFDRTNYYEVAPLDMVPFAIAAEADRMRHAFIKEEDRVSEMPIVRNEFEISENRPMDVLDKQLWAIAYQEHPYHHPTIGWKSDIEQVSIERLQKFYKDFYRPDNAVVTIAGGFEVESVLKQIKKEFGVHAAPKEPLQKVYTAEPKQEGERRVVVKRAGTSNLVGIAHKIPAAADADMPALLMLSLVLADGKTSRLYRALVDTSKATDVANFCYQLRDPSLIITYATLTPGTTHEAVETIVKQECLKIATEGVTARELQNAKKSIRSYIASRRDGPYAFLSSINEDIATGDWTRFVTVPQMLAEVTAKQIQAVAKKYLVDDQSTAGYFIGTSL